MGKLTRVQFETQAVFKEICVTLILGGFVDIFTGQIHSENDYQIQ